MKIRFLVIVYTTIAPNLEKLTNITKMLIDEWNNEKNSKHEVVKEIIQENLLELKNLNLQIDTWYLIDK